MEQLGRVLRKLGAGLGVRRVPRKNKKKSLSSDGRLKINTYPSAMHSSTFPVLCTRSMFGKSLAIVAVLVLGVYGD